jgi:hypothetical protein
MKISKITFSLYLLITLLLSINSSYADSDSFWCWFADFEGCAGVTPESGNARNLRNSGGHGIGNIGGKRDRVETRTIITIPDYTIRKIQRFFGLGGNRINISYSNSVQPDCYKQNHTEPIIENTLLSQNNLTQCMNALTNDLADSPNGLQLQISQCQDFFCQPDFIFKFEKYLNTHPAYQVRNINSFLSCNNQSFEI